MKNYKSRQRRRKRKNSKLAKWFSRRKKFKFQIRHLKVLFSWIFKIAVTVLLAFVFVWYMGQRVSTVGDSMNPALKNGDIALINRIIYNASSPKRGDIIAFKPRGNENNHYYIKRIVGMPGETVEMVENQIYINGKKLEDTHFTEKIKEAGVLSKKVKLANDEYFVMGDNVNNSEDSRNADVGNVKRSYIYGKVWFVAAPKSSFGLR